MPMTISDLGAIGELVGSFAVLLTLVYLAIQVRYSRELLERQERLGLGARGREQSVEAPGRRPTGNLSISLATFSGGRSPRVSEDG